MRLFEVVSQQIKKKILMEAEADRLFDQASKSLIDSINTLRNNPELQKHDIGEFADNLLKIINSFKNKFIRFKSAEPFTSSNYYNAWLTVTQKVNLTNMYAELAYQIKQFNTHLKKSDKESEALTKLQTNLEKKVKKASQFYFPAGEEYQINEQYQINGQYLRNLLHYDGIDYPPIKNYNPMEAIQSKKSISDIKEDLRKLEQDYVSNQKEMERYIPITGDEDWLLEVGEYRWLNHNDWCSKVDGKAMRHCGNSPYNRTKDRVYTLNSLKNFDGTMMRKPHVFFVIEEGGVLGERKGYGNSKPGPEYHDAIVEFIKLPIVKSLKGGARHAAENDFCLFDLSESQIEEITNQKGPHFFDMYLAEKDPIEFRRQVNNNIEHYKELFETYVAEAEQGGPEHRQLSIMIVYLYNILSSNDNKFYTQHRDIFFKLKLSSDDLVGLYVDEQIEYDTINEIFQNESYIKYVVSHEQKVTKSFTLVPVGISSNGNIKVKVKDRSDLLEFITGDTDLAEKILDGDYNVYSDYFDSNMLTYFTINNEVLIRIKEAIIGVIGEPMYNHIIEMGYEINASDLETVYDALDEVIDDENTILDETNLVSNLGKLYLVKDAIEMGYLRAEESATLENIYDSLYDTISESGIYINSFTYDEETKTEYVEIDIMLINVMLQMHYELIDTPDESGIELGSFDQPYDGWHSTPDQDDLNQSLLETLSDYF